jgi:hypothetical protein
MRVSHGHVSIWRAFNFVLLTSVCVSQTNVACLASRVANLSILYFKGLMAPATHDSDSNDSNAEASPKHPKSHGGSPEQPGQSDQDGPEDSGEEGCEVYEIEAILDAKRGATGSVRFLGRSLGLNRVLFLSQVKNRLSRQVEGLSRR